MQWNVSFHVINSNLTSPPWSSILTRLSLPAFETTKQFTVCLNTNMIFNTRLKGQQSKSLITFTSLQHHNLFFTPLRADEMFNSRLSAWIWPETRSAPDCAWYQHSVITSWTARHGEGVLVKIKQIPSLPENCLRHPLLMESVHLVVVCAVAQRRGYFYSLYCILSHSQQSAR